jgi:predicted nucleic acid-binding protein
VKAADTSLVVAAFASWHERHEPARRALDAGLRLPEHCALETHFPEPFLRLAPATYRNFLLGLAEREVTGGAAYDALVAATAADHAAELVTCDRRAAAVYERYGVKTQLL